MQTDYGCTVILQQCPATVDEKSVQRIFWNAKHIMRSDDFTDASCCDYYVTFGTPEEAHHAVSFGVVNIEGQDVQIVSPDDDQLIQEEEVHEVVLFGLPAKATVDDVGLIFPNALGVTIPKRGQFAFVRFATADEAHEAYQRQPYKLVGHILRVDYARGTMSQQEKIEHKARRSVLLIGGWPELTKEQITEVFPTCNAIRKQKSDPSVITVSLSTEEDAIQAAALGTVFIQGQPLNIQAVFGPKEQKQQAKAVAKGSMIVVAGCPSSITGNDIAVHFPTAVSIRFTNLSNANERMAQVTMPTMEDAEMAVAYQPTIIVQGLELRVFRTPGECRADQENRTIKVKECPKHATDEDLRQLFPNAIKFSQIHSPSKPTCTYFVMFQTSEEAVEASKYRGPTILGEQVVLKRIGTGSAPPPSSKKRKLSDVGPAVKGRPFTMQAKLASKEQKQQAKAVAKGSTIVIEGCPPLTTKADIAVHFPTAVHIRFTKPDDANMRMVQVMMPTMEDADMAVAYQPTIIVQGLELSVFRTPGDCRADEENRTVKVKECPKHAADEDLRQLFPNAIKFGRTRSPSKPTCTYFVLFRTPEEAMEASQYQEVTIHGEQVLLQHAGSTAPPPSKKPKLSDEGAAAFPSVAVPVQRHAMPPPSSPYPHAIPFLAPSHQPKVVPRPSAYRVPQPYPQPFCPTPISPAPPSYSQSTIPSPLSHERTHTVYHQRQNIRGKMFHAANRPSYRQSQQQLYYG